MNDGDFLLGILLGARIGAQGCHHRQRIARLKRRRDNYGDQLSVRRRLLHCHRAACGREEDESCVRRYTGVEEVPLLTPCYYDVT